MGPEQVAARLDLAGREGALREEAAAQLERLHARQQRLAQEAAESSAAVSIPLSASPFL
jgi:hypothetical protein